VKKAIAKLYKEASSKGVDLVKNAYPWNKQYLWYDPAEFPDIHVAHWRWWMGNRLAFLLWGLNAPIEETSA
ncbi:hypothetical protein PHMEG_00037362, partial [Phytophthora megakarya]